MLSSAPPVAVGTFAHTRRWAADVDKTLLVLKGQVPVRDGRVCYADGSVEGAQALEAVSFGARAKAVSADGLPDEAVLSALGGATLRLRGTQGRHGLGVSAAQAADWPRLAEARGSLKPDLALKRGLRRASWPSPEPPWFPHRLQLVQLVPETEDEVSASNPNPHPNPNPNPYPNPSPSPSPSPNPNPNPNEVSAVCGAVSLLGWHQENAFSGVDGSRTEIADGGLTLTLTPTLTLVDGGSTRLQPEARSPSPNRTEPPESEPKPKPEARAREPNCPKPKSKPNPNRSLSPTLAYSRREQAPARWPLAAPTRRPGGHRAGL
eukprot:scaffold41059_cov65-Phaeocystis_antarctica.AAC.3